MNKKSLFAVVSLLAATAMCTANASAAETNNADPKPAAPATTKSLKEMQEEFLKLKFGMFIHFNMATYKGSNGSRATIVPPTSIRAARSTPMPGRMRRCPPA